MRARLLALGLVLPLGAACASTRATQSVDLAPARQALEAARQAGAPERAAEAFARAEGHLHEAEALVQGRSDAESARQAESLARLAGAEARCAGDLAKLGASEGESPRAAAAPSADAERLAAKLRAAEEEQRRLQDKVEVLQRDLEVTETEVIRTKARLKGYETKAEASSAIAEARILMRRLADERGRTAGLARCQELIAKAELLLRQENYGAASFFALKAQDTATKADEAPASAAAADAAPPKARYVVRVRLANLRKEPTTSAPVVGTAPQDAALEASAVRGDWVKVRFGDVSGWVHRSLIE